jgi:ABC-type nitrate/sulfonate/bicarbonate transport system substrate-binding protein
MNAALRDRYATDPGYHRQRAEYAKGFIKRNREKVSAIQRAYNLANRWRIQQAVERWRRRNPEKFAAHQAVARARAAKKLTRLPCEVCGDPKSYAHHYLGYAPEHRLDVQWLCRIDHIRAHKSQ